MSRIKKVLIVIYLIATFLICAHLDAQVTFAEPVIPKEIYPSFGIVTNISETTWGAYVVTVSDFEGFSYEYYAEDGDLQNGDGMALLMYKNGTPDYIKDDVVVDARYVGHISFWTNMTFNVVSEICGEEELISE